MPGTATKVSEGTDKLFDTGEISPFNWKKSIGGMLASSAAIIFGVAVLLMSLLAVSNPVAVHPSTDIASQAAEMDATSASLMRIEYYLPYPGLLPDSPLYKVKALRDRIAFWLTFGEQDKARRELLYADKRINAAIFLVQGGKINLGVSTATKAEKYLESAVNRAIGEAKAGRDVKSLLSELAKACSKHLEVLDGLIQKVGGEGQKSLQVVYGTTQVSLEKVNQALAEAK
jgi:Domain of unknown function (DUF5667)